jgi:hypothetical protein
MYLIGRCMDTTRKKEEGTTYAVMAGWRHRGNGKKEDGCRRRTGMDSLEKGIGKAADRSINPYGSCSAIRAVLPSVSYKCKTWLGTQRSLEE